MESSGRSQDKISMAALSCDSFSAAYIVMLTLFFLPHCLADGWSNLIAVTPVVCVVPFAVMPLIYCLVHKFSPLLFGRYHLLMPLSAIVAAFGFVAAFTADISTAVGGCVTVIGLTVFVVAVMVNRYCAFSVRTRLSGVGIGKKTALSALFYFLGGACALSSMIGFYYYDKATVYANSAYIVGGACLIFAMLQYFFTYYDIPRFAGKRAAPVKKAFTAFYAGIDRRMYFSSLLFMATFFAAAMLNVYFAVRAGAGDDILFAVCAAPIAAYTLTGLIAGGGINRRSMRLSVAITLCGALCGIAMVIAAAVGGVLVTVCAVAAGVFAGIGGSLCSRQKELRFINIKTRVTSGIVFMLLRLTVCAAAGIAGAVAAVVAAVYTSTLSMPIAFAIGGGILIVMPVAAIALCAKPGRKPLASEPDYEPDEQTVTAGEAEAVDCVTENAE